MCANGRGVPFGDRCGSRPDRRSTQDPNSEQQPRPTGYVLPIIAAAVTWIAAEVVMLLRVGLLAAATMLWVGSIALLVVMFAAPKRPRSDNS